MAKTMPPGSINIPGVSEPFIANAVPDVFDERDLEYRPRLELLPARLDKRSNDKAFYVLTQVGNSCTGHAVAAVINTVLINAARAQASNSRSTRTPARLGKIKRSSPFMLYRLARIYDEFEGAEDIGSSLRGAFKGWFHHGVCVESEWPRLTLVREPDLEDPLFVSKCRERPLGAFYRVNSYRLDDMQSAISELHAIAVSSVIHDGWIEPVEMQNDRGDTMFVIKKRVNAGAIGGHAYALVGYNEVGFLVQNSWGKTWGKGGFATLPYEDWLDSAYDAWVARPGVPQTPFYSGRNRTAVGTHGKIAIGPGPDIKRLTYHVVNLGNQGRLSNTGKYRSTPTQIERIFEHMDQWHEFWHDRQPGQIHHVVLYAHGGLNSEASGLSLAQKHLNWWLNNRVYPIYFAWQTGVTETLVNQLVDSMKGRLPFGGIGFDLVEQFDRLVEKFARQTMRWMWDEMKENARAASEPIANQAQVAWPPSAAKEREMLGMPGASLLVSRLAQYIQKHGAEHVAVHLVGHSAGSIFHAALLERLAEAGIKVDSMSLLAPGIRVDEFRRDIYPHLGPGKTVARFANFVLSESRELDDGVGLPGFSIYHKSLLYLVSRALEQLSPDHRVESFEVPLLGLQRFFDRPFGPDSNQSLRDAVEAVGGALLVSRSLAPANSRTDALTHGGFDNDSPTMTSVLLRILSREAPEKENDFQEDVALLDGPTLATEAALPATSAGPETETEPIMFAAGVNSPGEENVVDTAEPQMQQPQAPPPAEGLSPEVAVAPVSGAPITDMLKVYGKWNEKPKNG